MILLRIQLSDGTYLYWSDEPHAPRSGIDQDIEYDTVIQGDVVIAESVSAPVGTDETSYTIGTVDVLIEGLTQQGTNGPDLIIAKLAAAEYHHADVFEILPDGTTNAFNMFVSLADPAIVERVLKVSLLSPAGVLANTPISNEPKVMAYGEVNKYPLNKSPNDRYYWWDAPPDVTDQCKKLFFKTEAGFGFTNSSVMIASKTAVISTYIAYQIDVPDFSAWTLSAGYSVENVASGERLDILNPDGEAYGVIAATPPAYLMQRDILFTGKFYRLTAQPADTEPNVEVNLFGANARIDGYASTWTTRRVGDARDTDHSGVRRIVVSGRGNTYLRDLKADIYAGSDRPYADILGRKVSPIGAAPVYVSTPFTILSGIVREHLEVGDVDAGSINQANVENPRKTGIIVGDGYKTTVLSVANKIATGAGYRIVDVDGKLGVRRLTTSSQPVTLKTDPRLLSLGYSKPSVFQMREKISWSGISEEDYRSYPAVVNALDKTIIETYADKVLSYARFNEWSGVSRVATIALHGENNLDLGTVIYSPFSEHDLQGGLGVITGKKRVLGYGMTEITVWLK